MNGRWISAATVMLLLSACAGKTDEPLPESYVRLTIDKSDPKRLLTYYFGGYVAPEPADPFGAGLLHDRSGLLYLDVDVLSRHRPDVARHLVDEDGSGRIEWEELETFIDRTYASVRSAPPSLDDLARRTGFDAADPSWMRVEVDGVMTTARRRIYVRESAIRQALRAYPDHDGRIIYPVGTTFLAEHRFGGEVVETTVMKKREDGFWDFFVYDGDGSLARGTTTPPRELKSPVQCVGCHFGDRLFEPERSFPALARPGPHGPRHVHVDDEARDEEVVRRFDEHRRRSDTILGLYTTLFVSRLRAQREAGTLSPEDAALLDSLHL